MTSSSVKSDSPSSLLNGEQTHPGKPKKARLSSADSSEEDNKTSDSNKKKRKTAWTKLAGAKAKFDAVMQSDESSNQHYSISENTTNRRLVEQVEHLKKQLKTREDQLTESDKQRRLLVAKQDGWEQANHDLTTEIASLNQKISVREKLAVCVAHEAIVQRVEVNYLSEKLAKTEVRFKEVFDVAFYKQCCMPHCDEHGIFLLHAPQKEGTPGHYVCLEHGPAMISNMPRSGILTCPTCRFRLPKGFSLVPVDAEFQYKNWKLDPIEIESANPTEVGVKVLYQDSIRELKVLSNASDNISWANFVSFEDFKALISRGRRSPLDLPDEEWAPQDQEGPSITSPSYSPTSPSYAPLSPSYTLPLEAIADASAMISAVARLEPAPERPLVRAD